MEISKAKTDALPELAHVIVTNVIVDNVEKGHEWQEQSVGDHLKHANQHITQAYLDYHGALSILDKEDIRNAITRLTMALSLMED